MSKYICAVIGNPISHSLSPVLHYNFAKENNINLRYLKLLATNESFAKRVKKFLFSGGTGINITAPFKYQAYNMAEKKTQRCIDSQSANTLWLEKNCIVADCTDGVGFYEDLIQITQAKKPIHNILILGAGGAARSICDALIKNKLCNIYILNRDLINANNLVKLFNCVTLHSDSHDIKYDLFIHATSNRNYSPSWENLIPYATASSIFYDINYYATRCSPWKLWANNRGYVAYDGFNMLYNQALISFYTWFDMLRP